MENLKKKQVLDNHMSNVVPKFQSCRLNGVAINAITYIHRYIQTTCRTYVIPKRMVIPTKSQGNNRLLRWLKIEILFPKGSTFKNINDEVSMRLSSDWQINLK